MRASKRYHFSIYEIFMAVVIINDNPLISCFYSVLRNKRTVSMSSSEANLHENTPDANVNVRAPESDPTLAKSHE